MVMRSAVDAVIGSTKVAIPIHPLSLLVWKPRSSKFDSWQMDLRTILLQQLNWTQKCIRLQHEGRDDIIPTHKRRCE